MVSKQELNELFHYENGKLYGKSVTWRRKASNSRVEGKQLGTKMSDGHLQINFTDKYGNKHRELVHRIIFGMFNDVIPEFLDHINRDPSDNRLSNLRPACKSLNSQNRGPQVNTKWGMRGIYKNPDNGRYYVHIKINGKRHSLGGTDCLEEARRLRRDGEARYWPDARPNESTA